MPQSGLPILPNRLMEGVVRGWGSNTVRLLKLSCQEWTKEQGDKVTRGKKEVYKDDTPKINALLQVPKLPLALTKTIGLLLALPTKAESLRVTSPCKSALNNSSTRLSYCHSWKKFTSALILKVGNVSELLLTMFITTAKPNGLGSTANLDPVCYNWPWPDISTLQIIPCT